MKWLHMPKTQIIPILVRERHFIGWVVVGRAIEVCVVDCCLKVGLIFLGVHCVRSEFFRTLYYAIST